MWGIVKKLSFGFVIIVATLSAGRAEECGAGSYINTVGKCVLCEPGYYCPGDNERHLCGPDMESQSPYYSDTYGAIECTKCPDAPELPGCEFVELGYWASDSIHTDVSRCRARYRRIAEELHGRVAFTCYYGNKGYGATDDDMGYGKCLTAYLAVCDVGYGIYIDRPGVTLGDSSDSYLAFMKNDLIQPAVRGFYSPNTSCDLVQCPSNTTTREPGATSQNECVALCAAGATKLRTSTGLSFNLYRDKLTTPALNIGFAGGQCYVPLEIGDGKNAINLRIGTTTYHTIY